MTIILTSCELCNTMPMKGNKLSKKCWLAACRDGDVIIVRKFMGKMAGTVDSVGNSGLMLAAENGHANVVRLLRGSENCFQNDDGTSALMLAAAHSHKDCVMLLMPYEMGLRDLQCRMAIDRTQSRALKQLLWLEQRRDQYQMRTFLQGIISDVDAMEGTQRQSSTERSAPTRLAWWEQQTESEFLHAVTSEL